MMVIMIIAEAPSQRPERCCHQLNGLATCRT
jgi:hypothetical protein